MRIQCTVSLCLLILFFLQVFHESRGDDDQNHYGNNGIEQTHTRATAGCAPVENCKSLLHPLQHDQIEIVNMNLSWEEHQSKQSS